MTYWKIVIYLQADDNPQPVTREEVEAVVISMSLPAGVEVVKSEIKEVR